MIAVHADKKWTELFLHFMSDVFKIADTEFQQIYESDNAVPLELSKRAWENLASWLSKIKQQKGVMFDDRLERIPEGQLQPLSASYYATVYEYCFLVVKSEYHPLNRLLHGVAELFCSSYASVGTSHIMYDDSAILEFR